MNILIVGLGSIAKKHIRALDDLGIHTDIVALRSSDTSQPLEGVQSISNISELIKTPDFAIVSNPAPLHLQTIEKLLPLQCPLFIEKPLALTLEGIDDTIKKIEEAGVKTYIGCQMRHHPCLRHLRETMNIKDCTIKSVTVYDGSYMPNWVPDKDFTKTIRVSEEVSGGVHMELIHEMDYVYWLFGNPENIQKEFKRTGILGVDIIDDAHYDLAYSGFTATIDVNYIDKTAKRSIQIETDNSVILADLLAGKIFENDQEIFSTDWTMREVLKAQMQYFLEALEKEIPPLNSVQEGLKVLQMALQ